MPKNKAETAAVATVVKPVAPRKPTQAEIWKLMRKLAEVNEEDYSDASINYLSEESGQLLDNRDAEALYFDSLFELRDGIQQLIDEQPIQFYVNDDSLEIVIDEDGVNAGCTLVSYEDFDRIAKAVAEYRSKLSK